MYSERRAFCFWTSKYPRAPAIQKPVYSESFRPTIILLDGVSISTAAGERVERSLRPKMTISDVWLWNRSQLQGMAPRRKGKYRSWLSSWRPSTVRPLRRTTDRTRPGCAPWAPRPVRWTSTIRLYIEMMKTKTHVCKYLKTIQGRVTGHGSVGHRHYADADADANKNKAVTQRKSIRDWSAMVETASRESEFNVIRIALYCHPSSIYGLIMVK